MLVMAASMMSGSHELKLCSLSQTSQAGSGCSEREYSPLTELACGIKKRLLPSRSDDPYVRIQVSLDAATLQVLKDRGTPRAGRGRGSSEVYIIAQYRDLNEILGDNWHFRVVNEAGDFSYAILESIAFHYCTSRPLLEYDVEKKDDGTLSLSPVYIEQSGSVVFTFVRGDGNRVSYDH